MVKSLVIVTKSLAPYRVRFYREIATDLKSRGWNVAVLTSSIKGNAHPWSNPIDMADDLRIFTVGGDATHKSVFWILISKLLNLTPTAAIPSKHLIELLEKERADVVLTHEHSLFCLTASLWASMRDRVSLMSTEIGDNPPAYACSKIGLYYHHLVSFLYQGVIAQTVEATRRSHPENIPVVFTPHAIDTDEYFPALHANTELFRFLFTGSLDDRKGVEQAISAGRILAAAGYKFQLRILGTGPLAAWLDKQPDNWISTGGFVEGIKLREEYRNANAYILPTRGDTYAVTIHEAAASGLPLIIGKYAGAVETLVTDGVSGFVIDPENVSVISQKMEYLLNNPDRAKEMGQAARKLAEQYDVKILARKAADFISEISTQIESVGS